MPNEIKEDEIRIISCASIADNKSSLQPKSQLHVKPKGKRKNRFVWIAVVSLVVIALACCLLLYFHFSSKEKPEGNDDVLELVTNPVDTPATDSVSETEAVQPAKGHVVISDTVVNKLPLTVFTPVNAVASLHVGSDILDDSTVVFAAQAADIRSDNGGIVGAFVKEGELLSKGQAKSGFCAIIGGKLTIGTADATPFLEQALENNGYFFRQYPLVVANQVVENKPKGESLRKALAELNGVPVVIMSREKATFHDFAQSLVDLGVSNAIYLVGSSAYGIAVDGTGNKIEFGKKAAVSSPNINYILWR